MSKVSREIAEQDVNRWLDANKTWERVRRQYSANIENLVCAVEDGMLVLNEDNTWTQKLTFPIGEVSEIKYKQRITTADLIKYKNELKGDDFETSMLRVLLAFTGQPLNVMRGLDRASDVKIAESIGVFFI